MEKDENKPAGIDPASVNHQTERHTKIHVNKKCNLERMSIFLYWVANGEKRMGIAPFAPQKPEAQASQTDNGSPGTAESR